MVKSELENVKKIATVSVDGSSFTYVVFQPKDSGGYGVAVSVTPKNPYSWIIAVRYDNIFDCFKYISSQLAGLRSYEISHSNEL